MEYIVSARKYRPLTFDTVVGQAALTTTLKNAVKSQKLAHAYLFCGPRGVGKTTCARIFAKAINCQHPTPDGEACNACESCQSFNEQRSLNIFELDAASNNSVEHIKTLMEQTRIPPQLGRYKVFIIDEVHMLSTAAFNAFLKTLEEPPAHVIFILATTEKHKILPTILSRCQIYDFERMTVRNTVAHLRHVAEQEGIRYEEEALAVIAEKADGGMRDALSIFDQAASFCQGDITYQKVIEDLNVLDSDNYFRIVELARTNKVSDIMVLLNGIINKGFDGGLLIQGLAKHVRNVLMAKDPQTLPLLEVSDEQRQRYQEQARQCDTRFLYRSLEYMNRCDINYRQSSNKRLLVELTLIEMAQITQPDDSAGAGPRPRRLKSLFKFLVQQSQPRQAVPQVAAAEQAAPAAAPQAASRPSVPQQPAAVAVTDPAAPQPASAQPQPQQPQGRARNQGPSLSSIGFSWNKLKQQSRPSKVNIIPGSIVDTKDHSREEQPFTQDDLELQWLSMCNRMSLKQQLIGIASRMKNMNPVILDLPKLQVTVDNDLIRQDMEAIHGSIVKTLQIYLHNQKISLEIVVTDRPEQVKILSRREQFELMEKENPAVTALREAFNLELA
ncbi:MAG: DNA polymerase III subunit gamma/tau [Prevotella sp.]|nr:DNA polymerase III subunit gamma/tau [Prevotella sp.]